MKIRVSHVINSLQFGGAETMLCNLLKRTDRGRFETRVISLIDDLSLAGPLLEMGIPIDVIGVKPGRPNPFAALRLARALRSSTPHVVQTWMDHSNLIGGVAARLLTGADVVWGIHHSHHVRGISKRSTLYTVDACARLSRFVPAKIICCSEHSKTLYVQGGFDPRRIKVIPNGFDTRAFCPDAAVRAEVRREMNIPPDAVVAGLAARYDPLKDHSNFLQAAATAAQRFPELFLLLCGDRVDEANAVLMQQIEKLGLRGRCVLLGARRDMPRIYKAIDIGVSSSLSEAFPLTVGEAMASGVPCAVTDVGDSRLIVGDTGRIAPSRNAAALAEALCDLLAMSGEDRAALGESARKRVVDLFDLGSITRRYEQVYLELADGPPTKAPAAPASLPANAFPLSST